MVFDDDRVGLLRGADVVDVTQALRERGFYFPSLELSRVIAEWEMLRAALEALLARGRGRPLCEYALAAPLPRPGKIIACANARGAPEDEAARRSWAGRAYLKASSAVVGTGATVALPRAAVEYEVELGIVIGAEPPRVGPSAPLPPVFGFTACIDLLARGPEERSLRGSRAGFAVLGPALITADELAAPLALAVESWQNEVRRLNTTFAALRHGVTDAVTAAAGWATLQPGDLILSGGVGPPRLLAPADTLRVRVEEIGQLTVHAAADG